jgi:hypothetical protein
MARANQPQNQRGGSHNKVCATHHEALPNSPRQLPPRLPPRLPVDGMLAVVEDRFEEVTHDG